MISDYHLHSNYSGDCKVPMDEMVHSAIALGIERLCFTEHLDLDYPPCGIDFTLDLAAYQKSIMGMQSTHSGKISVLFGIEIGMQHHLHDTYTDLITSHPFDFVIASNHLANGEDVYYPAYFENRSQNQGYLEYFEDMLDNVTHFDAFDVYGHLDYVIRYGDFEDKKLYYSDFQELLDAILSTLIKKDKGIELNTSGYRYGLGHPHPTTDILKRYHDLGGKIITLGSDAHYTKDLCSHFDTAKDLLKSLGYKYHTTFVQRKAEFHLL